jgi:hypothetical protein
MTMTGLYDPARHEPLDAPDWRDATARAALAHIVERTCAEFEPGLGWRAHPLDEPDAGVERFHNLYFGAGGVVWALRHLARAGAVDAAALPDVGTLVATLRDANRTQLTDSLHGTASYLFGDTGLDLLQWTFEPRAALADRLYGAVHGNLHNGAREPLWGNSGTVLAAIHMAEATGEARWGALVAQATQVLLDEMVLDADTGTWLWVQDLYGRPGVRYLGAGHGFAGNVYPFLRGAALLPADRVALVTERALATLEATVRLADGGANWFPGVNPQRPAHWLPPVQDCHGAPGIVCRLAGAPRTPAWDALLLAAGELTWHAGPLAKGASLCHGTAGSALALLKLWRRTGDARWLHRGRALAMHAAAQVERHRAQFGQGRHALWTGDLGVACVLWNAINAQDAFPTLDVF